MDKNGQYSNWNPRIPVFYAVFAAAFLFLLGTLAYRQIYLYDYYSQRGERQSMRRIIEPGARGDIYDRNMKLLVTNEPRFSAVVYFNEIRREFRREYMRLKKIELARRAAAGEDGPPNYSEISSRARANVLNGYVAQINSILGSNYKLTTADYNRHFENQRLLPFPIIKDLKGREHAILAERLPVDSPIQIYTDTARYYPYGPSAAHLLGYVGSNFDEIDTDGVPGDDLRTFSFVGKIGRSGLEKAFDSVLQGSSGAKIWVVDLDGYQYENVADVTPKKGRSVVSSIDIDLQQTIEDSFGTRKGVDRNLKGLDFTLAKCCNPIYGDEVFGFVSINGGIKIHRCDCPNAKEMRSRFPYRIVKARWAGKSQGKQYPITLRIIGHDDIGIVTNITSIINKENNILLRSISIDSHDGLFSGMLTVTVDDNAKLESLIKKIKTVKGVKQVNR